MVTSDEAPTNDSFKITTDKTEGWDMKEIPQGDGVISDELLEALESSEKP